MFLTRRMRSRTLRLILVGSKSAGTLKTRQKWKERHPQISLANLRRRSKDNRAEIISALLTEKIIACSQPNSNDLITEIAQMSLAVIPKPVWKG